MTRARWRRRRELPCRDLVELVSDSVEGGLTRRQRARVRRHLRGCRHCDRYLRQIRTTISVTGHVRVEDLESMPAGVRDDLLGAFREGRPG